MTELEIKILANKTYDSMVSQMRNIPGTTDKEIDIFMDKFTKNLREILIENNPEHGTKLFKEELIEKKIQNRAADKLYKTVFDRAETEEIKQNMLLNVAYIIDCCILENYREYHDDKLSIYDKICSTIVDIYFKEFCQIDLSKKDKEILEAIINTTLYKINGPCAIYSTLDQVLTSIICEQNVAQNDADIERIKDDIEHNSIEIIDRMNYLALEFTSLFLNKTLITDLYYLDAARIISISPYSFEYDRKLNYLIAILLTYQPKFNDAMGNKCEVCDK